MTYTELKNELLESAIYSLGKGASLLDVLLQAYELGKSGRMAGGVQMTHTRFAPADFAAVGAKRPGMASKCKLHPYYKGVGYPTTTRCTDCMDIYIEAHPLLAKRVSDLISAARAEGAEQERAWLQQYADNMGGAMKELVGRLLSAPLLAPDKESEHE